MSHHPPSSALVPTSGVIMDVALAPGHLPAQPSVRAAAVFTVFIVVDVIRASTTLCVLFEQGCPRVYVAASVPAAREAAVRLAGDRQTTRRLVLAGEIDGAAPPGFDHGNSPAEFATLDLAAIEVVFATSNGTRALHACRGGAAILVGALRNASAVAGAAVDQMKLALASDLQSSATALAQPQCAVMVVCAGRGGLPAYDDTVCAGMIAGLVAERLSTQGRPVILGEGAQIACATRDAALNRGLRAALATSAAAQAIAAIGLSADLEWCAALDASAVVPAVGGEMDGLLLVEPWTDAQRP